MPTVSNWNYSPAHTPNGPERSMDCAVIATVDGETRVIGEFFQILHHGVSVDPVAHARLASAAPELLKIAQEALLIAETLMLRQDTLRSKDFIDECKAAIAKAKAKA